MPRPSGASAAENETIVALATPEGTAGLAVVRLSGPGALDCARGIFECAAFGARIDSHRAYHGYVVHPEAGSGDRADGRAGAPAGRAVDEVVLLPMLAPGSYTGEDVVEISCHGGVQPARLVVEACLAAGARPAEAGEFTRRAFCNGRLSLDQAEAVADLIHAEDRLAARGALAQLRGGLKREIADIENPLLALLAALEGDLEFPEDEHAGTEVPREELLAVLDRSLGGIGDLVDLAGAGRRIREGVNVVLVGAPNSGKSSLFNALLDLPRALVDDEAGTTRDVISATLHHRGVRFELHDTAGLRDGGGRVESMGMDRARDFAAEADVVLLLRDLSLPGRRDDDRDTIARLVAPDAVVIEVGTKADLAPGAAKDSGPGAATAVATSAVTGGGVARLRDLVLEAVRTEGMERAASLGVVLNERHRLLLVGVAEELESLRTVAESGESDEVLATLLSSILTRLGEVSGRVYTEKLLGAVFSRFCVGK